MAQMRFIQRIAVVALALASSACATQWERPGSTREDLATDQEFCETTAKDEFANRDEGRLQGWATALDRRGAYERCMMAHGWGIKT
jgi:hypothetical protein